MKLYKWVISAKPNPKKVEMYENSISTVIYLKNLFCPRRINKKLPGANIFLLLQLSKDDELILQTLTARKQKIMKIMKTP